jgi:signal transduction histidine kinase
VLTDFLSIARLEEGALEPSVNRFSLGALIADLNSEAEGLLKPGQQFICNHDFDELEMISDKNIVRNILYNLISNAIKYSDDGTTIRFQVSIVEKNINISIQDEGQGIPQEDQKHIGSRFFRASNAVNIPGTGLGLNIVNSYLHVLRGKLTFESQPGTGTTFTIILPIQHEK